MQNIKQATRCAFLSTLIGLSMAADSAAAQRSLAQAISDSFEDATDETADPAAAAPQLVVVPVDEAAPMPARPLPMESGPPVTAPAHAGFHAEVNAAVESLDESLERGIDKFHEIVIAPERLRPIAAADPAMSCHELYNETSRLVALGERYRPSYAEDPRNIAIGAAGFVFTPAFYLYGVTAYASWYENGNRKTAKQRVSELRRLMADRRCFARD